MWASSARRLVMEWTCLPASRLISSKKEVSEASSEDLIKQVYLERRQTFLILVRAGLLLGGSDIFLREVDIAALSVDTKDLEDLTLTDADVLEEKSDGEERKLEIKNGQQRGEKRPEEE